MDVFIKQIGFSYIKLGDLKLPKAGRGICRANWTINTLIIKTKNNNKYYTWTGALNKTGSNRHTPKTTSGSSMTIGSISLIPLKCLLSNDSLFSLPLINPNPPKSKETSSKVNILIKKTKTLNLKILICPICSRTLSSRGKSLTKK